MRITILIMSLITFSAMADDGEWGNMNAWETKGFSQAYVTYQDKSTRTFQATIADNPSGEQVVEFRFYDSTRDICSTSADNSLNDAVIKINGKRVKMKAGCKRVSIMSIFRYFAVSEKGNAHIVNSFKSGDSVSINIQGYDIEIPAQGFEAAWENYGGDAI